MLAHVLCMTMKKQPSLPSQCERALKEHLRPELFRALCDPVRISIVATLATQSKAVTVSEITDCCDIDFSGVSRHLKLLRDAGVVAVEKQGREKLYSLDAEYLSSTLRALADALDMC